MQNFISAVLEYLRHDSTWKGIISLLTATGVAVKPELANAIITAGLGLVGLIQVFITDRSVTK